MIINRIIELEISILQVRINLNLVKNVFLNITGGSEEIRTGNSAHAISAHMCEEGMGSHQAHEPSHTYCRIRDPYIASDNQSQIRVLAFFLNIRPESLKILA